MTRGGYGPDEIYTRMAWASLDEWRALSARAELPIFHPAGVLIFFHREEAYATGSLAVHRRLGLPIEQVGPAELARRWPQVDWSGIAFGLHEPDFGALMARRSVQTLVEEFVRAGGEYRRAAIAPPAGSARLGFLVAGSGERLEAERFVFACGPWLPKLFPAILGNRIFPTRQEIFFFTPPAGDGRFGAASLPGWADFDGDFYYGFPDLEGRGFKIANDRHGPPADPDTLDRRPSEMGIADVRAYMARRFPALAGAPLSEARVCQYENSANGDFLIDRHPEWNNVLLVGGGSGHGFKHGPEVGRLAADLVLGRGAVEPRFSLATKATEQRRSVH
jgi:glycine/D-amino acid oxidase-like deaminating enzyme